MMTGLKRSWRSLKHARPGVRFQHYHDSRNRRDRPLWQRIAWIAGGTLIIAAGLIALPAPGPGSLIIVLGAALLGRELRPVAKLFDALELFLRRRWRRLRHTWKDTSPAGRVGLAVIGGIVGLGLLAAAGLVAYRLLRG